MFTPSKSQQEQFIDMMTARMLPGAIARALDVPEVDLRAWMGRLAATRVQEAPPTPEEIAAIVLEVQQERRQRPAPFNPRVRAERAFLPADDEPEDMQIAAE